MSNAPLDFERLPGRTPEERYDYLMTHLTRSERREIVNRRAEVQAWLRANPKIADMILGRAA